MTTPIEIAARVLECDIDEISKENYDHYGLDIFSANGEEFAIGLEEEAKEAVSEYIKESLWTFKPEIIAAHTKAGASNGMIRAISALVKDCEDCNEDLKTLIEDLDEFVDDVVSEDGIGTFLSPYDGEEREIEINGILFKCYRLQ